MGPRIGLAYSCEKNLHNNKTFRPKLNNSEIKIFPSHLCMNAQYPWLLLPSGENNLNGFQHHWVCDAWWVDQGLTQVSFSLGWSYSNYQNIILIFYWGNITLTILIYICYNQSEKLLVINWDGRCRQLNYMGTVAG